MAHHPRNTEGGRDGDKNDPSTRHRERERKNINKIVIKETNISSLSLSPISAIVSLGINLFDASVRLMRSRGVVIDFRRAESREGLPSYVTRAANSFA